MTPISSFAPGEAVEGVFAVRRKERGLSRQGRPFLALTLADATGADLSQRVRDGALEDDFTRCY